MLGIVFVIHDRFNYVLLMINAREGNSLSRTNSADVANIFVRNLLCDLSDLLGGFSHTDWDNTLKYFENRCAYTDIYLRKNDQVKDHLIPHNRYDIGLHLYGNIVPSSKKANAAKSNKNYKDFIQSNTSVLGNIDEDERKRRISKIDKFHEISSYSNKLKKIKKVLDLSQFIQHQYASIQNITKENINDISKYLDDQPLFDYGNGEHSNKKDGICKKIETWSTKPYLNVHKIIATILHNSNISKPVLISELDKLGLSKNCSGAINSLMSDGGNNYGKIIFEENGKIDFYPEIKDNIKLYTWNVQ